MRDDRAGAAASRPHPGIHWPAGMSPAEADSFIHREVAIAAPPAAVFERVADVERWPSWLSDVEHVSLAGRVERAGLFEVRLLGVRMDAMVGAYLPPTQFGWAGAATDLMMYQAWLLSPDPPYTRVIVEEVARGAAAMYRGSLCGRLDEDYRRLLDRLRQVMEQPTEPT